MEIVKKIISLEPLRSRQFGLIPYCGMETVDGKYVLSENGNWGNYPFDIDITKCKGYESLQTCFGTTKVVSYSQILSKWKLFVGILSNATYYKKIRTPKQNRWVTFQPSFGEKLSLSVIDSGLFSSYEWEELNNTSFKFKKVGIYDDNSFFENGGFLMIEFLLKALGMFVVERKFIKTDNYVPEIMYYMEIEEYIKKINKSLKKDTCCVGDERLKYGNSEFSTWLSSKIYERKVIFNFWCNALNKDDNGKPTVNMYIPLTLIKDYKNIGIFDEIEDSNKNIDEEVRLIELIEDKPLTMRSFSRLKGLKRDKKSYATIIREELITDADGNTTKGEVEETIEMPVILDEVSDNRFILTPKYVLGCPINCKQVGDEFYGDVIYNIENNKDNDDYVDIYYVIGGKLRPTTDIEKQNGEYRFLDTYRYDEDSYTGIRFKETIRCEIKDFTKEELEIRQLFYDSEVNILTWGLVDNVKNVKVYYDVETDGVIDGTFYMTKLTPVDNTMLIMNDYNFGKTESLIENIEDIVIDRGYISAFELHYKLGEINTFEDLQNYQNNIFGM